MPELPEAESIVRGIRPAVCGQTLGRPLLRHRSIVRGRHRRAMGRMLDGRRVVDVGRRAKRVVLRLDGNLTLVFTLGMTGGLSVEAASAKPLLHTHLRIPIGDGERELRFRDPRRFGRIWLLDGDCDACGNPLADLGPEPLEIGVRKFRRLLQRKRQIKALLLDQRIIAGLGNIYCDEALHRARIHPLTRAHTLTPEQGGELLGHVKGVLRAAIRAGGSTVADFRDGRGWPGRFQHRHRVYQRQGLPCRRCGTPIVRITAGGRSTHLCPRCQPLST